MNILENLINPNKCPSDSPVFIVDTQKCNPLKTVKERPPPQPKSIKAYTLRKSTNSYAPRINKNLVTLKTTRHPPEKLNACNLKQAFTYKEPIRFNIRDKCLDYKHPDSQKKLLKILKSSKHINPYKVIPPKQFDANCWFNALFVCFFISDKGRKFFHFLRQAMIQPLKTPLDNSFALLNYAILCAQYGYPEAYNLNTNYIIQQIYLALPKQADIYKRNQAGNPLYYYLSIIQFLTQNTPKLKTTNLYNTIITHPNWHLDILSAPDIITAQIDEEQSGNIQKPMEFTLPTGEKYKLDSITIRNTEKSHFACLITVEGKYFGFDGASYSRIVPFNWNTQLNNNFLWSFKGSSEYDMSKITWNFTNAYMILFYYRVK